MKVCTDSCLFGAWIADKIEKKKIAPQTILDIGTGTGLLSLMIAQKFNGRIEALEIEENSFLQAKENFSDSPWSDQLKVNHTDLKNWNEQREYDLIISNPPFFENDLASLNQNKNLAKHPAGLTFKELLQSIEDNLSNQGHFALLLPFSRIEYLKKVALGKGFFLQEELLVKQTSGHSCFRGILLFGTEPAIVISNELVIKDSDGNYSEAFNILLKDYYL